MPRTVLRSWEGGRALKKRGREVFVIERMVSGRRYSIPLAGITESDAILELRHFERDPSGYELKSRGGEPLELTSDLITDYLTDLHRDGCSRIHYDDQRRYLLQWEEALKGRDLRNVTLREYRLALRTWKTAERHRTVALKGFCSWLRSEGELQATQDASTELKLPAPRAEKVTREKGYEMAHVEAIYAEIEDASVRDFVRVAACTGMHGSEIRRIARGQATIIRVGKGEIAATVQFPHKSGTHTQSLDAATLGAIERLREPKGKNARGRQRAHAPVTTWIRRQVKAAAERANMEPINVGSLRHCFVTWARTHGRRVVPEQGSGVDLAGIAAAIGHRSPATTRAYYDETKVPELILVPIRLLHPQDRRSEAPGEKSADVSAPVVLRVLQGSG